MASGQWRAGPSAGPGGRGWAGGGNGSASAELLRLITGYRISQAVYVAAKLGIADRIADGPKDAETLARETGVRADPLFRTLRALAAVGVLTLDASKRFGLTRLGQSLRTDVPRTVAAFAVFQGEESYRAFADLLHTVRTGETAFDHVYGMGHFEYLAGHPEASAIFNAAMGVSARISGTLGEGYDFSRRRVVVDVGGGHGAVLAAVLAANPHLRGILYDLPAAVTEAPAFLASQGVAERCTIRTGSAFESIPPGGDVYLMSRLLHDFPDDRAAVLLRNCRRAIPSSGVLLLREGVLPETEVPARRVSLDLEMMALNGGRERTEAEWRALLRGEGFELSRVLPGAASQDLLEARPVGAHFRARKAKPSGF